MTNEQASAVFLEAFCPVAHLLKQGNANVNNYQAWRKIAVKLSKTTESSTQVVKGDGSTVWPPVIADYVERFIDVLLDDNAAMSLLGMANSEEEFWKYQGRWADDRDPIPSKRIRLELGLDADGDKACKTAGV